MVSISCLSYNSGLCPTNMTWCKGYHVYITHFGVWLITDVTESIAMSNQQPPPAPATVNLNDILREEIAPIVKNMQDQLSQQLRANAAAEVEARERMKADLLQEHSRLQKRVGAMLEEDSKRAPAKPRDLLGEADNDETEASGEEEDFPVQGQASKRIKPDEEDKKLWLETRRMSDEFPEEDWKKVKVSKLMDFYSGHADAKVFKALEADPEVGLRYDSDKAAEKHSKEMESLVGAAAGALTSAMRQVLMVRIRLVFLLITDCCLGCQGFHGKL